MLHILNQFSVSPSEVSNSRGTLDDIFGFGGNGCLHLSVSRGSDWHNRDTRSLNVGICYYDFTAVFESALRSIGLEPVDTSGDFDWEKFDANQRRFEFEFPQFPMMASYQDNYQDYVLGPAEISTLLRECEALQKVPLSYEADLALRKLIYGCEEAASEEGYLIFICD
jgi:hypothetical protein